MRADLGRWLTAWRRPGPRPALEHPFDEPPPNHAHPAVAAAALAAQALVEYGLLNTLARDVSFAIQRLGRWATDNVLVVAVIAIALAVLAFRRR